VWCGVRHWLLELVRWISVCLTGLLCTTAAGAPAYAPGEVVVLLDGSGAGTDELFSPAAIHGASRRMGGRTAGQSVSWRVVRSTGLSTDGLITQLSGMPGVRAVSPNYLRYNFGSVPGDPQFGLQWGLHNTGQYVRTSAGLVDADVDFPESRALANGGAAPVVIAILDTGMDMSHPELAARLWWNPGEIPDNGVDDDENGYIDDVHGYDFAGDGERLADSDPSDNSILGHGTHVAGAAAAMADNGLGVAGVYGGAQIMVLKTSFDGESYYMADVIEGIAYATMMRVDHGVNVVVINASLGAAGVYNEAEAAAVSGAIDAGIVFCAAAGNGGTDGVGDNNDTLPIYPASYPMDGLLSVAASDMSDQLAGFSNDGVGSVDLAAPGVDVYSTLPRHLDTVAQVVTATGSLPAMGMYFSDVTNGVSGVLYDCGYGRTNEFDVGVAGHIALIKRGPIVDGLLFTEKVTHAMAAGATAVVIYNYEAGMVGGTLQWPNGYVPTVMVDDANGAVLLAIATNGGAATVVNAPALGSGYGFSNGTSMASPHVAGAVAMLAAHHPELTAPEAAARILAATDPVSAFAGRMTSGGRLNLRRILDLDDDAMPDWWEELHTSSVTNMGGASDYDRDGLSDADEFRSGTDPADHRDLLGVADVSFAGGQMHFEWDSVQGKHYQLQHATSATGIYTGVSGIMTATPPRNTHAVVPQPAIRKFYRLILETD
jgi:subtilisin family serine protease